MNSTSCKQGMSVYKATRLQQAVVSQARLAEVATRCAHGPRWQGVLRRASNVVRLVGVVAHRIGIERTLQATFSCSHLVNTALTEPTPAKRRNQSKDLQSQASMDHFDHLTALPGSSRRRLRPPQHSVAWSTGAGARAAPPYPPCLPPAGIGPKRRCARFQGRSY